MCQENLKKSFAKFNEKFYTEFHKWEVVTIYDDGRFIIATWEKSPVDGLEFESPEHQYQAMIDYVNGCRFSDTEYHVFMDGRLTNL